MTEFRCCWCSHTRLKSAEFMWYERPLLLILLRPTYCPHCFARFYRPLKQVESTARRVRERLEHSRLKLLGRSAAVFGGLLLAVGVLASPWLGVKALIVVTTLGLASLVPGAIGIALNRALTELRRVESKVEAVGELIEEHRERHPGEDATRDPLERIRPR